MPLPHSHSRITFADEPLLSADSCACHPTQGALCQCNGARPTEIYRDNEGAILATNPRASGAAVVVTPIRVTPYLPHTYLTPNLLSLTIFSLSGAFFLSTLRPPLPPSDRGQPPEGRSRAKMGGASVFRYPCGGGGQRPRWMSGLRDPVPTREREKNGQRGGHTE